MTNDQILLQMVKGVTFELADQPAQIAIHSEYKFDDTTKLKLNDEVIGFLNRGIIEECKHEPGKIICNIFCRKKKSGNLRTIGNFKDLNYHIDYHKFKQATVGGVLDMIRPSDFMTSIDLKDAYYCLNIHPDHRKYVKFKWGHKLYQFTCMGNGIASAPRIFTQGLKVLIIYLREMGIVVVAYIDDLIILNSNPEQCARDTATT